MSRLLIARVVLVVAAVAIFTLHIVVIVVIVIEEVRALVGSRDTRTDAVLGQRGGDFHTIALSFRFGGHNLFPEGNIKNIYS